MSAAELNKARDYRWQKQWGKFRKGKMIKWEEEKDEQSREKQSLGLL